MSVGLNLKPVKFGKDSIGIIEQVENWLENDTTGYVRNRLFNGQNGSFQSLVDGSLGSRVRLQEAYAYLCDGVVIGVLFTTTTFNENSCFENVNITTICANPEDAVHLVESEMIGDLKRRVAKRNFPNIFSDFSYVNEDLAKIYAANDFYVMKEKNNIHVVYQIEKAHEKTM